MLGDDGEGVFQPSGELQKDFYAELPIRIRLRGSFHELAAFVSGVAALPRIVTLHDIAISRAKDENDLVLDLTAKTYRYLEEDDGSVFLHDPDLGGCARVAQLEGTHLAVAPAATLVGAAVGVGTATAAPTATGVRCVRQARPLPRISHR